MVYFRKNIKQTKEGFTLAEILITLGIIGVVAAMTIPALYTSISKRQTLSKLQKAYSLINQAYRLSYSENGDLTAEEVKDFGVDEYFKIYWAPYIKADLCHSYQECGYNTALPWIFLNGQVCGTHPVWEKHKITFKTPDGILYVINATGGTGGGEVSNTIIVDLNGAVLPNTFGKDVFMFKRNQTDNGIEIVPSGNSKSSATINKNCSSSSFGEYCAEKIRSAGWKIDSSYPW